MDAKECEECGEDFEDSVEEPLLKRGMLFCGDFCWDRYLEANPEDAPEPSWDWDDE